MYKICSIQGMTYHYEDLKIKLHSPTYVDLYCTSSMIVCETTFSSFHSAIILFSDLSIIDKFSKNLFSMLRKYFVSKTTQNDHFWTKLWQRWLWWMDNRMLWIYLNQHNYCWHCKWGKFIFHWCFLSITFHIEKWVSTKIQYTKMPASCRKWKIRLLKVHQ